MGEAGRVFVARHPAGDLDCALDERRHVGKSQRLEVQALDAGRGKDRGHVGKVVVGLAAEGLEDANALRGEAQRLTDGGDLAQGRQGKDAPPAALRARVLKQKGPDLVELERPKRHSVHVAKPTLYSIELVSEAPEARNPLGAARALFPVEVAVHEEDRDRPPIPVPQRGDRTTDKMWRINGFVKVG
jgi:hypothetical protein